MSSTDLDTPPTKLILLAILMVVGLHVLTAVALVAMKTDKPQLEPKEEIPPVEIEFVTLPAKTAAATVETKEPVQQVKKATVKKEVQPEPQAKPVQQPKAVTQPKKRVETPPKKTVETPIKPVEPVIEKQVAKQIPETAPIIATEKASIESRQIVVPKKTQPEPITPEIPPKTKPTVDTSAAEEQRQRAAAQAKAAQEAEAKRAQAKAAQEAQEKAAQEAQRIADAKAAAQAQAAKEAEAAAQAKAAREAAEAAARAEAQSNEPVSFTASAANWASAPRFSFPERAARRARSGDTLNVVLSLRVNKQGGIDSVRVAQSSGNTLVDKEAQRQVRSGKFKPFTKNGVPVVGNVTLPISYAVP